jgi:uncharacterized protein YggT (Ycf19 family)
MTLVHRRRIVSALLLVCFGAWVLMISFIKSLQSIRPRAPIGQFVYPLTNRGTVVYLTRGEHMLDDLSPLVFVLGLLVLAVGQWWIKESK